MGTGTTLDGCLQGKRIKAVATAKRHTVVLTVDGDIYTWGHRVVTPKRVLLSGQPLPHCLSGVPTVSQPLVIWSSLSEYHWAKAWFWGPVVCRCCLNMSMARYRWHGKDILRSSWLESFCTYLAAYVHSRGT